MTSYTTRPGVLLTEVCGEYLLVCTKQAREHCPFYTQISESAAFLWKLLTSGSDLDAMEQAVLREYEIQDPAQARELIHGFVEQLFERGYLLRKGEQHEE